MTVPDSPTLDIHQPFMIETSNLRGRAVRLGPILHHIITRHDYPARVNGWLAELVLLAALLSRMLKSGNGLTIQVQGDGPLKLMVADVMANGDLRACATLDAESPLFHTVNDAELPLQDFTGKAYLAITLEPGDGGERYQGIVPLEHASLSECVIAYFRQSEQIEVALQLAAGPDKQGNWHAGGILLQQLPEQSAPATENVLFLDFGGDTSASYGSEAWNRAKLFLRSVTRYELLDAELPMPDLLYRLFHEEGVRLFDATPLTEGCRCSRERIEGFLRDLSPGEREELYEAGFIRVRCEFCNREELFDDELRG
jgi:molecular chaperone Hsp33